MSILSRGFTLKSDGTIPGTKLYDVNDREIGCVTKLQILIDASDFLPNTYVEFAKIVKPEGYLHKECEGCEIKDTCVHWDVDALKECSRCAQRVLVTPSEEHMLFDYAQRDSDGIPEDLPCCLFVSSDPEYLCPTCNIELDISLGEQDENNNADT